MSGQSRNAILLEILNELRDQPITVTGVRDLIIERSTSDVIDPAALRRWVNGQFVTLERKGVMTKHAKNDSRKSFFLITNNFDDRSITENSVKPKKPKAAEVPQDARSNSLLSLEGELESHRLRALTELSEIDEYKRIIKQYPDLSVKTRDKFNAAIEENCKTLGKIKALEEILEYKALSA